MIWTQNPAFSGTSHLADTQLRGRLKSVKTLALFLFSLLFVVAGSPLPDLGNRPQPGGDCCGSCHQGDEGSSCCEGKPTLRLTKGCPCGHDDSHASLLLSLVGLLPSTAEMEPVSAHCGAVHFDWTVPHSVSPSPEIPPPRTA